MDLIGTILITLVTLGILVSVHEYGHFWVARRCGVKVLRVSIGFGKPIWRRTGADGAARSAQDVGQVVSFGSNTHRSASLFDGGY